MSIPAAGGTLRRAHRTLQPSTACSHHPGCPSPANPPRDVVGAAGRSAVAASIAGALRPHGLSVSAVKSSQPLGALDRTPAGGSPADVLRSQREATQRFLSKALSPFPAAALPAPLAASEPQLRAIRAALKEIERLLKRPNPAGPRWERGAVAALGALVTARDELAAQFDGVRRHPSPFSPGAWPSDARDSRGAQSALADPSAGKGGASLGSALP